MKNWFMITIVGEDRPGIVAKVTQVLHQGKCNLGEASMARLGGNFTIMLMVEHEGTVDTLEQMLAPVCDSLNLRCHVDLIEGKLHEHVEPDVCISVHGADRPGIVAEVTGALARSGFNILNLESDVGGTDERPIYIMHMEGVAVKGVEPLKQALARLNKKLDVETRLKEIDVLRG